MFCTIFLSYLDVEIYMLNTGQSETIKLCTQLLRNECETLIPVATRSQGQKAEEVNIT